MCQISIRRRESYQLTSLLMMVCFLVVDDGGGSNGGLTNVVTAKWTTIYSTLFWMSMFNWIFVFQWLFSGISVCWGGKSLAELERPYALHMEATFCIYIFPKVVVDSSTASTSKSMLWLILPLVPWLSYYCCVAPDMICRVLLNLLLFVLYMLI